MNRADITVVIPTYNSESTIKRAVDSVIKQTLLPREIIVVDDCSQDSTVTLLYEIKDNYDYLIPIIVIQSETNGGPGSARNLGMEVANGKYIAFLDSDDAWHPQKIEIQYAYLCQDPELYFCSHDLEEISNENYSNYIRSDHSAHVIKVKQISYIRSLFMHYGTMGTDGIIIRNIPEFRFEKGKRCFEDCQLWSIILSSHKGLHIYDSLGVVFKNFYGKSGLSGNIWQMEKGELETFVFLKRNGLISFPIFLSVSFFSLVKYIRRYIICEIRKA